ncbi:MAG: AMP-binding protein [Christensenellales bacterium]|jgi:fatty-acyl-CoA synthase
MSELMNITVGGMLEQNAQRYPEREAIISPEAGVRWTWKQFDEITDEAARGMMAMGIKRGDKVAIWATNVPEWMVTCFASAKIGAVLVTVNTNYKQYEAEYLLRQSDTHTLVMIDACKDSNYVEHIQNLNKDLDKTEPGKLDNPKLPFLKNLVYIGKKEDTPKGFFHFDDLYEMGKRISKEQLQAEKDANDPDDVVNMQYTSGTTGFPKGVMLTHNNIVNNGRSIGDCMLFTEKDKLLIVVPLFHCFGLVLATMASLTHATSMVLVSKFHPVTVMQTVEDEKCTALHGVPTMFISQLEHPDFKTFDLSSLRTGIMAGSPCPIQIMQRVVDEMHMKDIVITYGQTESSPGITNSRVDDPIELRVSTVGRVMPNIEAKIVNPETNEEIPYGETGEIVTRGYHIMKGYYKMEEATKQAIDEDGWLHTGDLGTMDENGYFKVTGRLKDMIIRGGENLYPREIEEFLYTHPAVKDVQVVGVPDMKYGEEACAFVILKESESIDEQTLIDFVKQGMARHKVPRYVRFIDAFPMTASGKIQKYKLREQAIESLGLQDAAKIETA